LAGPTDLFEVQADGSVLLAVQVQPGAARSGVAGRHGDALKLRIAAPAERGKANAAVARFLADAIGLRARQVEIVGGTTSRRKRVRLEGADVGRLVEWLDANAPG
jgi:uncharacterized protein (TIGR00251 family)